MTGGTIWGSGSELSALLFFRGRLCIFIFQRGLTVIAIVMKEHLWTFSKMNLFTMDMTGEQSPMNISSPGKNLCSIVSFPGVSC